MTAGISAGAGFVSGMALGNEAGMLRGLVEYNLNPEYPDPDCGCD